MTAAPPGPTGAVPAGRAGRAVPDHLVVADQPRHGVSLLAGQLARATGARTVPTLEAGRGGASPGPAHLHFCDRLLGTTPEDAAAEVERLAAGTPLTVTLHDVPAPADGPSYDRRVLAYRRVLAVATGWVTSSRTEQHRVHDALAPRTRGAVVPLPLVAPAHPARRAPVAPARATVGVLGWIYPGKGHEEALHAVAAIGQGRDERPRVVAIGGPAPGHDDLVEDLLALAHRLGVDLEVTGWLPSPEFEAALAACDLGVAGHQNVSASGSVNSWIAAGHVPLVRDSPYAREMSDLRPGTVSLYGPGSDTALAEALLGRLARPATLPPAPLPWNLADVALAYRGWWGRDG